MLRDRLGLFYKLSDQSLPTTLLSVASALAWDSSCFRRNRNDPVISFRSWRQDSGIWGPSMLVSRAGDQYISNDCKEQPSQTPGRVT